MADYSRCNVDVQIPTPQPVAISTLILTETDRIPMCLYEWCVWARIDSQLKLDLLVGVFIVSFFALRRFLLTPTLMDLWAISLSIFGHRGDYLGTGVVKREDFAHLLRQCVEKGWFRAVAVTVCRKNFQIVRIWVWHMSELSNSRAEGDLSTLVHQVDYLAAAWRVRDDINFPISALRILNCLWPWFLRFRLWRAFQINFV